MHKNLTYVFALLLIASLASAQDPPKTVGSLYAGLSSGPLATARVEALPPNAIFKSGEMVLTQKDLDAEIRKSPQTLWPQLKRNLFFVLENRATGDLLLAEARLWAGETKRSHTEREDSLMPAYVSHLTSKASVTEDELKTFFEENKDMMGSATYDQVKEQLREFVLDQKRREMISAHVNGIGDRFDIQVNEAWVAKQYAAAMDNPVDKARKSGKPSLVDFGADGCRPCDMMAPILNAVKKEYAGKLNLVFVHVRKEQILGARYGASSIPMQVFFDKGGKEVFRHIGFYSKEEIKARLAEIGVK